jgi:hypothetical protein
MVCDCSEIRTDLEARFAEVRAPRRQGLSPEDRLTVWKSMLEPIHHAASRLEEVIRRNQIAPEETSKIVGWLCAVGWAAERVLPMSMEFSTHFGSGSVEGIKPLHDGIGAMFVLVHRTISLRRDHRVGAPSPHFIFAADGVPSRQRGDSPHQLLPRLLDDLRGRLVGPLAVDLEDGGDGLRACIEQAISKRPSRGAGETPGDPDDDTDEADGALDRPDAGDPSMDDPDGEPLREPMPSGPDQEPAAMAPPPLQRLPALPEAASLLVGPLPPVAPSRRMRQQRSDP